MKIFLITVVAVYAAVCYGNPVDYNAEFGAHRAANLQMTQKLANEAQSTEEHYRALHAPRQSSRNEYRRFGKDALPLNSQTDGVALTRDHKTNVFQTRNPEFQDASFSNDNQANNFPTTSGTPVSKSSFYRQDLRSNLPYARHQVPQIQEFSSPEMKRPDVVEDRSSTTNLHNPEDSSKVPPFSLDHPTEIQTGVYSSQNVLGSISDAVQKQDSQAEKARFQTQDAHEDGRVVDQSSDIRGRNVNQNDKNILGTRSDTVQDQVSQSQRAGFQNQGDFKVNSLSTEDQNERIFSHSDIRQPGGISQNMNHITQIQQGSQQEQVKSSQEPLQYQHFSQQGQIKSSHEPRNQYQHFSQQGQIKPSQEQENQYQPNQRAVRPVSKDSLDQVPNRFESRRISGDRQPENKNKYASTFVQYPSNQQKGSSYVNENLYIASDFKDDFNKQDGIWNRKHDVETRTGDVAQGHFQTLSGQKTFFTAPQFRQGHAQSVPVSGSKGGPVVLYRTGSVASSHAVVIDRDSGLPRKGASLTHHLKTPYAHYTYSHGL